MLKYKVNFHDNTDMQTWVVDIEAPSDNEALGVAEQHRKEQAMDPDNTEVYSITSLDTGKDIYLSPRAQA